MRHFLLFAEDHDSALAKNSFYLRDYCLSWKRLLTAVLLAASGLLRWWFGTRCAGVCQPLLRSPLTMGDESTRNDRGPNERDEQRRFSTPLNWFYAAVATETVDWVSGSTEAPAEFTGGENRTQQRLDSPASCVRVWRSFFPRSFHFRIMSTNLCCSATTSAIGRTSHCALRILLQASLTGRSFFSLSSLSLSQSFMGHSSARSMSSPSFLWSVASKKIHNRLPGTVKYNEIQATTSSNNTYLL